MTGGSGRMSRGQKKTAPAGGAEAAIAWGNNHRRGGEAVT
jgi:hypothetical protein